MKLERNKPVDFCVNELYKINEWYGNKYQTATVMQLTHAKTRIVTLLCTLATYVAEAKVDFKERESQYEHLFNKINLAYLDGDETVARAKSKAIIDTEEDKKILLTAYKYYTHLDYFYNRMSSIADSMTQDIATLKTEQKQTQSL